MIASGIALMIASAINFFSFVGVDLIPFVSFASFFFLLNSLNIVYTSSPPLEIPQVKFVSSHF